MLGLGGVRGRVAIGSVTVLAAAAVTWYSGPARAVVPAAPVAAIGTEVRSAGIGAVGTGAATAAVRPTATPTPFEISYGRHRRQSYLGYLPATRSSRMAVVVVHGGSWISGSAMSGRPYNTRFYDEGIASFSVDYRWATEAPWPAQRNDLKAALSDIRAHAVAWGFDPGAIAIVGVSAGGHLALDLGDRSGRRATCAVVSYSAPTSIKLVLKDGPRGTKQTRLATAARKLAPTAATRASATIPNTPAAGDAPALLFASEFDWVNQLNSIRYAQAYDGVPVDVETSILPGETRHASGYALNVPDVWPETLAFLHRHCD